jgi:cytochrome P450
MAYFVCSEPIRSTLTHMSYYLVSYPQVATKLRMELVGPVDLSDDCALRQLPYLRAVIQETMRLHPPVPASGQRITPPQGVMINDVFIPPDTTVLIPQYSLGHSE